MGNSAAVSYPIGIRVDARYSGNDATFHPGKIVRVHSATNQYDVKFLSTGEIRTVSWDDIKSNPYGVPLEPIPSEPRPITTTSSPSTQRRTYFDADFDWEGLYGIDIDAVLDDIERLERELETISTVDLPMDGAMKLNLSSASEHEWDAVIKSVDRSLRNNERMTLRVTLSDGTKSKRPSTAMSLSKMKKMESLLTAIGGESLCESVLKYDGQQTAKRIVERIEGAAEQKADEIRFVERLKSVEMVDGDGGSDGGSDGDFWSKYGMRCRLTMDLDFDEVAAENEEFGEQMTAEIASILEVDASLIRIDSTERGSVIVTVTLCAIGAVILFFAGWSMDRVSFDIKRKLRRKRKIADGEMLADVGPGDEVLVDWNGRQYAARVLEKTESAQDGWITVHYDDDPFLMQNTEKLSLSSSRLHLKEPGGVLRANLYPDEGGDVAIDIGVIEPVLQSSPSPSPSPGSPDQWQ